MRENIFTSICMYVLCVNVRVFMHTHIRTYILASVYSIGVQQCDHKDLCIIRMCTYTCSVTQVDFYDAYIRMYT